MSPLDLAKFCAFFTPLYAPPHGLYDGNVTIEDVTNLDFLAKGESMFRQFDTAEFLVWHHLQVKKFSLPSHRDCMLHTIRFRVRWIAVGIAFLSVFSSSHAAEREPLPRTASGFPDRPIRIIVYTGPGGLIDFTARKFAEVASRYVDQRLVVINKPGAGGIVAFEEVSKLPADGLTLMAVTKSNIAKITAAGRTDLLDRFDWFARLIEDPQALIVNRRLPLHTWEAIYADALSNPGRQLWLGPDIGGLDHISALKIQRATGIKARWIPYSSGRQAIAALLGGLGTLYVGNPGEACGSDDLEVAAVCSAERLPMFPNVPTFRELGVEGLDDEVMWRGFVIKKGVPNDVLAWWDRLFELVNADKDWRESWEKDGIKVSYMRQPEFTKIVAQDAEQSRFYLESLGMIGTERAQLPWHFGLTLGDVVPLGVAALVLLNLVVALLLYRFRRRLAKFGEILGLSILITLAMVLGLQTILLPPATRIDPVGPSGVPLFSCLILLFLNLMGLFTMRREPANAVGAIPLLLPMLLLFCALYALGMWVLGYALATLLFIPATCLLGWRQPLPIVALAAGWVFFSYILFQKLLFVDLPVGLLFRTTS